MGIPRITSFLQLALLALVAVLVPPTIALGTALVSVEQLARQGSNTVLDAARTVDLARSVAEHVTAMERVARQRRALGDADHVLLDRYELRRAELLDVVAQMQALSLPVELADRLDALEQAEGRVHDVVVHEPPESEAYAAAIDGFSELSGMSRAILEGSSAAITAAATGLRADADAFERRLIREAAWVVPLVLFLLALAGVGIGRPLRALDAAIRRIGSGELDRPIAISGPADLRDLGTRLEWLRERLVAVESDRVRLLRHVSHELKTPLTCIREGNQLLEDGVTGALSSAQHELTTIIGANAAELGHRIDDLLRASDLSKGEAPLDLHLVQLDDVVRRVLDQSRIAARSRAVRIEADLDPVELVGDGAKLRTVVDNLVSNAIKFSPEGGRVRVSLRDGSEVVIAVEDEGPGLDPTERERVFEAFVQGKATWMRGVGGTGLGLAIARQYVRAHGGELEVEDAEVGARLVVRLGAGGAA
ncbi:MAG: HAMP domain-containing sensor histidine kinase [Myxococcota bacterium]